LEQLGSPPLGLGHGGKDQVTEELRITAGEHGRVDHYRVDRAPSVRGHLDQAATGRGLDDPARQLGMQLLQPALHLLAELKELLKIRHAFG
jgi:hypothetical protein